MDVFLILHADHEQNASTSTVRIAGSSQANPCVPFHVRLTMQQTTLLSQMGVQRRFGYALVPALCVFRSGARV